MEIHKILKDLRAKNKISQAQLAKIVDTKVTSVSRWELGKVTPNLEMASKLASALQVSLDEFCGKKISKVSRLEKLAKKASGLPEVKVKVLEAVLNEFLKS
jgi:transcriptional regulator with XRE-family HTH domain